MLLHNDVYLGTDSRSMPEIRWHAAELAGHLQQLRTVFDYRAFAAAAAGPATPAPPAVQTQLGQVFTAYLDLQDALARDDLPAARAAAAATSAAWQAVDAGQLQGEAAGSFAPVRADMEAGLATLARAQDLDALREGFWPVSRALIAAAGTLGLRTGGQLFQLHCPMAFDYQGADWLQPDPNIRNPYMGKSMPGCGDVRGELPALR